MSQEDLDVMLAAAGGRCDICGELHSALVVDHDHQDGRVRGVICRADNLLLGLARDRPDVLLRAAEYLTGVPALPAAIGTA
jgi:Recombination endonuclease VII